MIVQQRLDAAIAPVTSLGGRLLREGLTALAVVLLVTSLLWYFVVQTLRRPRFTNGSRPVQRGTDTSIHSRETITSPGPG